MGQPGDHRRLRLRPCSSFVLPFKEPRPEQGCRTREKGLVEMDQDPRGPPFSIALAEWVWRVFRQPIERSACDNIYRGTGRASPYAKIPGRISGISPAAPDPI